MNGDEKEDDAQQKRINSNNSSDHKKLSFIFT